MKIVITFILSELFFYGIALGIMIIIYPTMPIQAALIIAAVVCVFAGTAKLIMDFIIKLASDTYREHKEKNK